MIASQEGNAAAARELLARGADVNARSNDGGMALHLACTDSHAEALRELHERVGVNVNAQSSDGRTPLVKACQESHRAAAALLLDGGADLALLDDDGDVARGSGRGGAARGAQ